MMVPVLSTQVGIPRSFPKSLLQQPFCREPADACFWTKELYSRRYLKNIPEFLKHKEDCTTAIY